MVTKGANGILLGRALVSQSRRIGGTRSVFVQLGGAKNELVYVPFGAMLQNPFPGTAKAYAGDLFEYVLDDYAENPKIYLLKTYEVYSYDADKKTVSLVRDGFHHIPFVTDKIGVAPETIGGKMESFTITKVEKATEGTQKVWVVSFADTLTTAPAQGDVLVEADADGNMLIKSINTLTPNDLDFVWSAAANPEDDDNFDDARYHIPAVLGGLMYTKKMSPLPPCVLALNESHVNGWFKIGSWGNF